MISFKEYWSKFCPTTNREQARKMWNDYLTVSQASTDFEKKDYMISTNYHVNDFYAEMVSLGSCKVLEPMPCQTAACPPANPWLTKNKGNNPMYVDNDKHIESSKINYLSDRAVTARYLAKEKVQEAFNLIRPAPPKTPEDLVAAITAGNYTILPKEERSKYAYPMESIVWRAPTVKADPDGAEVALKVFEVLYKSAQDAIMISTPAEALTAVQALDAWTPTVGTVDS